MENWLILGHASTDMDWVDTDGWYSGWGSYKDVTSPEDGVWLVDPDGRWFVQQTKELTPGSWGSRVTTGTYAGVDGAYWHGQSEMIQIAEGTFGFTVIINGADRREVLANQALFMAGVGRAGLLFYWPDWETSWECACSFVVKSVTAEFLGATANRVVVSLRRADPFWFGHMVTGTVTPGEFTVPVPPGSGPLRCQWKIPAGCHSFQVTDDSSLGIQGTFVDFRTPTPLPDPVWLRGWESHAGVERWFNIYPGLSGDYKLKIGCSGDGSPVGIEYRVAASWL